MPTEAEKYITDPVLLDNFKRGHQQGGKAPGGTGILTGAVDNVSAFLKGLQDLKFQQDGSNQSSFRPAGEAIGNAVQQGFSNLGDFIFGGEDFGYMERSEDERDTANRKMLEKFLEDQRIKDQSNLGDRLIQNRPRDEMSLFGQRDR